MIELILSILADFGIILGDFKHRRKVSKKEAKDGNKRPFQKYLLQPSSIAIILIFVIGNIIGFVFFSYQGNSVLPKETKKEISEISERMEMWNEKYNSYPETLSEIIGNNPLRKLWENDSWNRPYEYSTTNNRKKFLIISAGFDGKFGTDDDIKSE